MPPPGSRRLPRFPGDGAHGDRRAGRVGQPGSWRAVAAAPQPAAAPIGPTPSGEPLSSPLSAPQARFEAGVELLAARVYPQAVELFEGLAGTPPAETGDARPAQPGPDLRAAALFNMGVARAALRLDEQAIQAFTTYIAGSPADARAYLYLDRKSVV